MKKTLVTAMSALLATGALAGCGSDGEGSGSSAAATATPAGASAAPTAAAKKEEAKPFTISLRHVQVRDDAKQRLKMLEDVVKKTEAGVPGLKIELEGLEDKVHRFEKLPAEMAAGTPPKIFDLFGGTDTQKFVKAGRLLDLTPIITELGIKDKFFNLDEFTVDGKIYGLPMAGFVEGVFYNKKIFKDLGADVPKTWDDLLAVSDKAKAKGITPFALASADAWVINMMTNTMWVRTAGPDSVPGFVSGSKKWTDPDVLDAFKRYETLVKKGYFQEGNLGLKYAEQQNKFRNGEAAMLFDGSWSNSALVDPEKSKIANDVGFFNFPAMGGKGDGLINGSYSNGYGFSSNLNDREKTAVKEFIKQMYNEEMQKRQLKESGFLPAMKLTDLSGVNPIVGEILQAANNKQFPAFDSILQAKAREALENGMQELLGGKTTAEKLMEKLQKAQDDANKDNAK
ncbi:extracellular solute-binding protein [Gorillibacterium sp. sgz5001074]|uniref:extracellular solute-binding protein n=1 Tax=Gorillibacterium sp. sgz5001074 TaxID=3446695 RepID=UPI003F66CC99